jgi:hypothetical protein
MWSTRLQGVSLDYDKWAPLVTKDYPTQHFMLYFFEIIQLLVEERNRYYHLYLGTRDERPLPTAWRDFSGNVFVFGSYCADGA